MFSCCCAYTGGFFGVEPVCDCYKGQCPVPTPPTLAPATRAPRHMEGVSPFAENVCCESCADDAARNQSVSYYAFAVVRSLHDMRTYYADNWHAALSNACTWDRVIHGVCAGHL